MRENSITSKQLITAIVDEVVKVTNDSINILEVDLKDATNKIVGMALLVEYKSKDIDDKCVELEIDNKNNIIFKSQYVWGDDVKKRLNKEWWYENLYDGLLVEIIKSGLISTKFNRLITLPLIKQQLLEQTKEVKEQVEEGGKEIKFKAKE